MKIGITNALFLFALSSALISPAQAAPTFTFGRARVFQNLEKLQIYARVFQRLHLNSKHQTVTADSSFLMVHHDKDPISFDGYLSNWTDDPTVIQKSGELFTTVYLNVFIPDEYFNEKLAKITFFSNGKEIMNLPSSIKFPPPGDYVYQVLPNYYIVEMDRSAMINAKVTQTNFDFVNFGNLSMQLTYSDNLTVSHSIPVKAF